MSGSKDHHLSPLRSVVSAAGSKGWATTNNLTNPSMDPHIVAVSAARIGASRTGTSRAGASWT
ncbi:MAG: hypothetical protein ACR2QO_08180 [Acidimicrobiales bacterium]